MLTVTDEAFPGAGILTCAECRTPMPTGTAYTQSLTGVVGDLPLVEIVCLTCGGERCPNGDRPCETDDERNVRKYDWPSVTPDSQNGWLCWMCAEPVKR